MALTSHRLSRGMLGCRLGVCRFACMCVLVCTCQRGASAVGVIQEAGLGHKNDEKKDSLPDPWRCSATCEFGPFRPLGLALVHLQHIKRGCVYWIQELWIRPALCFFSHQVLF